MSDAGLTVAELAAHGPWSAELGDRMSAALRLCLAGPAASIIVDLHDLADQRGASLSFWLAMWQQARLRAVPVRVTFSLPDAAVLSRRLRYLQGPRPTVFATVAKARAAIAERAPAAERVQMFLPPRPTSVRAARTLITQACQSWQMEKLLPDSHLVVSELVANAVEHARTDLVVTAARAGAGLHLAVHDCVSSFPRLGSPDVLAERGRGLPLVDTIAAAWGAVPTREGKVVWATVT